MIDGIHGLTMMVDIHNLPSKFLGVILLGPGLLNVVGISCLSVVLFLQVVVHLLLCCLLHGHRIGPYCPESPSIAVINC